MLGDPPVGVERDGDQADRVEGLAEAALGFQERGLGRDPVGDVAGVDDGAGAGRARRAGGSRPIRASGRCRRRGGNGRRPPGVWPVVRASSNARLTTLRSSRWTSRRPLRPRYHSPDAPSVDWIAPTMYGDRPVLIEDRDHVARLVGEAAMERLAPAQVLVGLALGGDITQVPDPVVLGALRLRHERRPSRRPAHAAVAPGDDERRVRAIVGLARGHQVGDHGGIVDRADDEPRVAPDDLVQDPSRSSSGRPR